MKRSLVLLAFVSVLAVSCGCYQQPIGGAPYSYMQGPGGQQMVVCHDNGTQFMMDYLLFTSLMNRGGYGAVMNNYHTYPSRYGYNPSLYRNYRPFNGQSYNARSYNGYKSYDSWHSSTGSRPVYRNTTPTTGTPKASTWGSRPSASPSKSSWGGGSSRSPSRSSGGGWGGGSRSSSRRR